MEYIYRYFIMVADGASVAYHRGILRKKSTSRVANVLTVPRRARGEKVEIILFIQRRERM